jgi:hypothetical protein
VLLQKRRVFDSIYERREFESQSRTMNIDGAGNGRTNPLQLLILQDTEQLRLNSKRQVTGLIQDMECSDPRIQTLPLDRESRP